jgi:preprotein translocase subunit SecE
MSDSKAAPTPRQRRTEERTSLATFYRQVVAELRKVVWPTQQQLSTYFVVVMVFVCVMMAVTSGLDLGFGKLVFWVFG